METVKLPKAGNGKYTFAFIGSLIVIVIVIGVAIATLRVADWGAGHQFVRQQAISLKLQLPYRIEERKPEVIVSPLVDKIDTKEFTTTEQKIIDKWGYRDGIMAIAIFDCGESGLDQYAVSHTGDLGIAQINWTTWKKTAVERFKFNAADMFDVDKNLELAYVVWDRGDGKEGNKEGTWDAWVGYLNGGYLRCLR